MPTLAGRTIFITGASRGIGLAIALRAARDGANVVIAAKTETPHPKLPGTIHTAASEIEAAGGHALAVAVDIRDEVAVQRSVDSAVARFGGIDVLVNNASAINLTGTRDTPMRRFDLMLGVNVRGTFACSQACLPHLAAAAKAGRNPHILTLAPPLNMKVRWFKDHVAYTIAKYGMSMCVLGMAEEFRSLGIAVNALWPRTIIATSALAMIPGMAERLENCRTPEILADAAHAILVRDARKATGHFYIDEEVLAEEGVTDLARYAVKPGAPLLPDIFLD
jgi:citronellol/citronellal dehydrogenase